MKLTQPQKEIIKLMRVLNKPFLYKALVRKGGLSREEMEDLLVKNLITRDNYDSRISAFYELTDLGKTIELQ